jgi:metastasis-associated protein MTA
LISDAATNIIFTRFVSIGALEDGEEETENTSDQQRHQLKHRELFLSRQVETLPATHIRGKCVVTLLNETESLLSYLNKEVSH